jgi:metallo-beta-lactamase class B
MRCKNTVPLITALAMSVGLARSQATFDTANIPQPHLAAARAIAAEENTWRHPGLATCYPDDADPIINSTESATPPTKIFDNLYIVGNNNLSIFALDTSNGIILFDAMDNPQEVDEFILPDLRKVGLDASRLKILIISHGHGDHFGGAKYLQDTYGVRVYLSAADWEMIEKQGKSKTAAPRRDMVAKDGDTITLGEESIKVFISPGHTPGSLSMLIPVKDHGRPRLLAYFGGAGNLYQTSELHTAFDRSWGRLVQIMSDAKVDGFISNHARYSDSTFKTEFLRSHPDNPNPFLVGTADTVRFVQEVKECSLNNVAIEQAMPSWRYVRR